MTESYLKKKEAYQDGKCEDAWTKVFANDVPLGDVVQELLGPEVALDLSGKRRIVVLSGSQLPLVTNFAPFYNRIYVEICPACVCVEQPQILKPFLEAGLVVPIYTSSLTRYPASFLDILEPFPHICAVYDDFLRAASLFIHEDKYMNKHICWDCFNKGIERLSLQFKSLKIDDGLKKLVGGQIFPRLNIRSSLHMDIINSLLKDLEAQGVAVLPRFLSIAQGVALLDKHITYRAQTALQADELNVLLEVHKTLFPTQQVGFIGSDIINDACVSLGISYSKEVPLKEYMKIIGPHIGQCTEVVSAKEGDQAAFLANTLDRVRDINSEIERCASSKRKKLMTFATWFTRAGSQLLAPFIGGGLGWYAGGPECGAGGALAGTAAKYLNELAQKPIKLPEDVKSQLVAFMEPTQLKLLAKYYGISLEAVQIWHMRERIRKLDKKKDS